MKSGIWVAAVGTVAICAPACLPGSPRFLESKRRRERLRGCSLRSLRNVPYSAAALFRSKEEWAGVFSTPDGPIRNLINKYFSPLKQILLTERTTFSVPDYWHLRQRENYAKRTLHWIILGDI